MKISVIVPVYNNEETIERCISSIINQTVAEIEIIVINDGSDDKTPEILKKFSDSRIKIISQKNSGQGYARNRGMDIATGEYISFVDADDTIELNMLDEMYKKAKEHSAEIVQCNLLDIYPDSTSKVQLKMPDCLVEINNTAEYISKYFAPCVHSYEVCNKLFKREFLVENNLRFRDTKKYFSEDILFNMEAVKHLKRMYFYSEPFYNYYQHPQSHMHKNAEERLLKMSLLFEEYLQSTDMQIKPAVSYLSAMVMLYNIGCCSDKKLSYKVLKELSPIIKLALKAVKRTKHKVFLSLIAISPISLKWKLTKFLVRG